MVSFTFCFMKLTINKDIPMQQFEALKNIQNIGDVEDNFIVTIAKGVSLFINSIDGELNKLKKSHLDILYNMQDSRLIDDIEATFTQSEFVKNKDVLVLKVPRTKRFFTTNIFYTSNLNLLTDEILFIENTILDIKRFRTKPKTRLSVQDPDKDTIRVQKLLKAIEDNKKDVFDVNDKEEYAKLSFYFGNVESIRTSIDRMKETNRKITDKDLHKLKASVERLSSELKKLIKTLDSTTQVVSKAAMNNIILKVDVAANLITSIAILYNIHVDSIGSIIDLQEKID